MTSAAATVRKVKVKKLDTNVFSLELGTALASKVSTATGDACFCRSCSAYLNAKSVIVTNDHRTEDLDHQSNKIWKCEFCGTSQEIFVEDEQMPKEESVDYLLNEDSSSSSSSSSSLTEIEKDEGMEVVGGQQ